MARDTLIDFFRDLSQARGGFLVHDDGFRSRTRSYADVGRAARGFAARLHQAGVRKGDAVLFWSENRPEWIVAFWGCLLRGVIVVPIDYRASPDFLTRVGRIVRAKVVLVGQDVAPLQYDEAPVWKLHELEWRDGGESPPVEIARDDVAEIIFTSGATAEPKGVVITHRNILANTSPVEREILKYRKWARPFSPLRFLNLLPLSHMFGQAMATFIPPMLAGQVIFIRGYNPGEIVAQINKRRVSVLVSVPKILDVLREHVMRIERGRDPERVALHGHAAGAGHERGRERVALHGQAAGAGHESGRDPERVALHGQAAGAGHERGRERVARHGHAADAGHGHAAAEVARPFQGRGKHFAIRWWTYRNIHRLFGFKFWAFVVGAAPLDAELEQFWTTLGFAVVQGYGLTETAPIVTLNHPFAMKRGSVGKPIAGVEMKIAPDGEILVRGENVTQGYLNAERETAQAFEDGWFHTGDIGEIAPDGQVYIRGRKKEMIVTPEGLNVFPEDVERVLNATTGVRDSAIVGGRVGSEERVVAVLVPEAGASVDAIVRAANARLDDHQRIRRAIVWPDAELPRTEGTRKLKRAAIRDWVATGVAPAASRHGEDKLAALMAKYALGNELRSDTTIEELGLSSLDRVELMVAIEDAFQTRLDESAFAETRNLEQLRSLVERSSADTPPDEPVDFPTWNRAWPARAIRRASLPTWILPLARLFAWTHVEGRNHLTQIRGPVIFAANHQSHMDTPVIMSALPARFRYRVAPAMAKEFFKAHFYPDQHTRRQRFTNGLNYYLAALFFNAFPLPQREAGARQTLRYIGEVLEAGFSVLIFPEGKRTTSGEIAPFRPGIGMIASRLGVPVVPVRIDGLDRVLHATWKMAKPGRVRVAFGAPMPLTGEDYAALAKQVENAVRAL